MTPRTSPRATIGEQRRIAKLDVIVEDISQITACPKCAGILRWAVDIRYEDVVYCLYCGWRPRAKLETEPSKFSPFSSGSFKPEEKGENG